MKTPRFTDLAASLPATVPFVGPETQERIAGRPFRARLGANESLFGPSPMAVAAMQKAAAEVWMYGDPDCHDLKQALAARHGVAAENIVVGEGIDGLLGLLCRLLIAPGDPVATSLGAYPTFNFHVTGFAGVIRFAPYLANHENPEALLALAQQTDAKLLYLANPDNPMGSHHPGTAIEALIDALPQGTLLVLDEAYIDLAPEGTAARIAADDPRVIRLRTFSKAYGMAGARVGYAVCAAPLAKAFDKVRNHFGVGRIAQTGALAALQDAAHLPRIRAQTLTARATLNDIAQANGLLPLPSATNFVTLDCGRDGGFARAVLRELLTQDIFVRMPGVAPLDRCIRVSLGDPRAMQAFADALPQALVAARG
jgi:histidinol-phosphate aminotransferase